MAQLGRVSPEKKFVGIGRGSNLGPLAPQFCSVSTTLQGLPLDRRSLASWLMIIIHLVVSHGGTECNKPKHDKSLALTRPRRWFQIALETFCEEQAGKAKEMSKTRVLFWHDF